MRTSGQERFPLMSRINVKKIRGRCTILPYAVLAVFVGANVLQGATWASLASVPRASQMLFGPTMGPSELSWQMNANSIAQIVMVLPTMWLLSRRAGARGRAGGLRTVIHLGCGFIFIQNALWWAAARSIGVVPGDRGTTVTKAALLVGAVLGGFGEMMLQSAHHRSCRRTGSRRTRAALPPQSLQSVATLANASRTSSISMLRPPPRSRPRSL